MEDGRAFIASLEPDMPVEDMTAAIVAHPAYKDAGAHYCRLTAEYLFDSGDYAGAWRIFSALGEEYRTRAAEFAALYQAAEDHLADGLFDEAEAGFTALGTYGDSEARAEACREGRRAAAYAAASALLEEEKYGEAAAAFSALGDYRDAADMISECAYRKALAAERAGDRVTAEALLLGLMADRETLDRESAAAGADEAERCLVILSHAGYKDPPRSSAA